MKKRIEDGTAEDQLLMRFGRIILLADHELQLPFYVHAKLDKKVKYGCNHMGGSFAWQSYGENTYKAIFSVSEVLGENRIEDCVEKVMSHRLVCAKPVMTLYEAFFPWNFRLQHLQQLSSVFDNKKSGLMLDECDPEVVIVAVYDKAPE